MTAGGTGTYTTGTGSPSGASEMAGALDMLLTQAALGPLRQFFPGRPALRFARALAGQFKPTQHLGFEFCAWYWHFVDVVWLFLFACIYVWGASPG